MINRHWDPQKRFVGAVLRPYQNWVAEVSWNQHALGAFIIFLRREGVRLISGCTARELEELPFVMRDIECAVRQRFGADHFNYLQLGNGFPYLHFHGIPRYETSREYAGRAWRDSTWGKPPVWSRKTVARELVESIRKDLRPLLPVSDEE